MDIITLIISLIGTSAAVYVLYITVDVPIWLSYIVVVACLLIIGILIYNFIRRRAQRYAAISLGLEWIRLIYDTDESERIRVSYFNKFFNRLRNTVRVPSGTLLTRETFSIGEGYAGFLWERYLKHSKENAIRVPDLPSAKEDQEKLIELLQTKGIKLDPKKVLRFKDDIKSYLILAVPHPVSGKFLGVVCLDSIDGNSFDSDDDLVYTKLVIDKLAKTLYYVGVGVGKRR
ncbi:MAG: hypothetical protein NTW26_04850 [bacterium]|nr:hypothetical protein [bacterium]